MNVSTNKLYENGSRNQLELLNHIHSSSDNIINKLNDYQQKILQASGADK